MHLSTRISLGFATFALGSTLTAGLASAQANGPCGVPAMGSLFVECLVGATTLRYGGTGQAAQDSFRNTTSPVRITNGVGAPAQMLPPITVTSNPVWSQNPVGTFLRLDGRINVFEPGAFIRILFEGFLGGVRVNVIDTGNITVDTDLRIPNYNPAAPAGTPAVSTMTVTVSGGASYVAVGSPVFVGAIPEPATLSLVGVGLLATGVIIRRRRSLKVA